MDGPVGREIGFHGGIGNAGRAGSGEGGGGASALEVSACVDPQEPSQVLQRMTHEVVFRDEPA